MPITPAILDEKPKIADLSQPELMFRKAILDWCTAAKVSIQTIENYIANTEGDWGGGGGLPAGGATDEILAKISATDGDAGWRNYFSYFQAQSVSQSGASVVIDLLGQKFQYCDMSGDAAISASNIAAARFASIKLVAGAADRALTFPADWKWLGEDVSAGVTLSADKVAVISISSYTTLDSGIVAVYAWQA